MSADFAYLRPIRRRRNLTIKTRALVTRLLFNQKVCVGVEAVIGKRIVTFEARKEVILSGGAINSPQILELSGVGQPQILEKNNIPLVQAINGVGENLRDHIGPRLVFRITKPGIAYNDAARGMNLLKEILKYGINRSGFLSLPSAPLLGFFKTRTELAGPDIQVHFIPYRVVLENGKRKLGKEPGMTCTINQNQPESVGSVHIKSPDPQQHPAIRYNFLSSRLDIDTLVAGVRLVRDIMNTDQMQMYCGEEMSPGSDCSSDEDVLAFIRNKAETVYHPVGTCKMGKDTKSVVDEKLRVHQIKNLRIADASIMPTLTSGNTNGPCMMIGEKCADFIMNH
jgi:choline dehydrogenase